MNIKNTIVASSFLLGSVLASSASALVPTSPLYDITPSVPSQSQASESTRDGVVLLFGSEQTPVSGSYDTLATPSTGTSFAAE